MSKLYRKQTMREYLSKNCICSPDSDYNVSVCGFPCSAKYHWRDEVERMKVVMSLPRVYILK